MIKFGNPYFVRCKKDIQSFLKKIKYLILQKCNSYNLKKSYEENLNINIKIFQLLNHNVYKISILSYTQEDQIFQN